MTEMELCKRKLERAVEIHRLESRPGPSGFVCALGLMIPSHLWASDADDMIAADNRDCDDARTVMDNWFAGLSRREKLVVFYQMWACRNGQRTNFLGKRSAGTWRRRGPFYQYEP